jgi:acyl-coenzyme A synthetase/AMP-(fatty) acid ligase/acyl carrier protein
MASLFHISPSDRWASATAPTFDISLLEWMLPLSVGACIVLANQGEREDARKLHSLLEASRATIFQSTPTRWKMLLSAGELPDSLKLCLTGGEALSAELANQLSRDNRREVWNLYGPTETTIWSTACRLSKDPYDCPPPIGLPIANTTIVVRGAGGDKLRKGSFGELLIGGIGLAIGYNNSPEVTAQSFLWDDVTQQILYRTGDNVEIGEGGTLFYRGRTDGQIKLRGHRVEISEIELQLQEMPQVQLAAVIPKTDHLGQVSIAAYVSSDVGIDVAELRMYLAKRLPSYMMPTTITALTRLPLSANGKIDRIALATLQLTNEGGEVPKVDCDNPQILSLRSLWQELFEIDDIRPQDDFFTLGGHSLLATLLLLRVQDSFGVVIELGDLLDNSKLSELANLIQRRTR